MSEIYRSRVSSKGQVVIPAEVRSRYGFTEGTEVFITGEDGRLIVEKTGFDEIYQLQGAVRGLPSALQLLEEERRKEREREERSR
ncbi:MAG TPA: AbrB/MazE/SpoVT family DNA-binding domain-containing protein [Terriglobales bacterium]|jgi:AbrB family looped-hinge helix DNA binding protein|nr:AbrB/MazE/SpoVT family DNA-binding domain-containing protein [Terriglobales bacterium]